MQVNIGLDRDLYYTKEVDMIVSYFYIYSDLTLKLYFLLFFILQKNWQSYRKRPRVYRLRKHYRFLWFQILLEWNRNP